MTRCKGCGKEFRKGVLAFLLTPKGLTGARVCQACASGGVLLVAPRVAPVVQNKTVRSDGVKRALRMLRTYANVSRHHAGMNGGIGRDAHAAGRAEGFEGAIELLKRECGQ